MKREQVAAILEALADKYAFDFNPPLERWGDQYPESERRRPERGDWEVLEAKFGCTFEDSFVHFMELIPDYNLPSVLEVRRDKPSHHLDSGRIDQHWEKEMREFDWNPAMIPFIMVGNGDYYCLRATPDGRSPVWYRDHEDGSDQQLTENFAEFLDKLEWHINGT